MRPYRRMRSSGTISLVRTRLFALTTLVVAICGASVIPAVTAVEATSTVVGLGASASTASPTKSDQLPCYGQAISPPPNFTVVLGVVAVPAAPKFANALQTTRTYGGERFRLFAKTGLYFKRGKRFEISVPAVMADQLAIGWGGPGVPRPFAYSDPCSGMPHEWVGVPGGYWVNETMCAPLNIRAGSRTATVRIGIGTPCPHQGRPIGFTES